MFFRHNNLDYVPPRYFCKICLDKSFKNGKIVYIVESKIVNGKAVIKLEFQGKLT